MSVETVSSVRLQNGQQFKDSLFQFSENTTLYPDELHSLLERIPSIDNVYKLSTENPMNVVKEKPFAMDLTDELRRIRAMKVFGDDPYLYWQFFKDQAQYYANEAYAKLGSISFEHQLVNDHGNLRLWIEPMGKSAKESYAEAARKGGADWYVNRCNRETEAIDDWERHLQLYLGHQVIVDISPAPFDVDAAELEDTMFGSHSFVRFHQMVKDEQNVPYVFSRAFRTYLPPAGLETAFQTFTQEKMPWEKMLGTFAPIAGTIADLRDDREAVRIQTVLNTLWDQTPIDQRPSLDEQTIQRAQMEGYYRAIEFQLRSVFDQMVVDRDHGESEELFLYRLVQDFQTWEKMLQGYITGDWEVKKEEFSTQYKVPEVDLLPLLYNYYEQQEYRPSTNACGTGSGASMSRGTVLHGTASVYGSIMNYGGMSATQERKFSKGKEVCVVCPYCKNEKGNKKIGSKYICGNKKCRSNK